MDKAAVRVFTLIMKEEFLLTGNKEETLRRPFWEMDYPEDGAYIRAVFAHAKVITAYAGIYNFGCLAAHPGMTHENTLRVFDAVLLAFS